LELKDDADREIYIVSPALWQELATEPTLKPKYLITAINRQGTLFLWEANLPSPDGRRDEWSRTALEAIEIAQTKWVRMSANMSSGCYDVFAANSQLTEPEWPADKTFEDILRIAFKDRYIASLDHPKLRELRGEV
jgi:hypothetical protein